MKYNMCEMNDLNGKGKKLYPKMFSAGIFESDQVAEDIARRCTLNEADVKGALSALSQILSEQMANGYSVKLDGIGIFSAALSVKKGKKQESIDGPRRNAQSLEVGKIHFRADKKLLQSTNSHCAPERTTQKFHTSNCQFSLEERIALAKDFIQAHGRMKIADYAQLTGLTQSTATRELRKLSLRPHSELQATEKGPLKHYIWVETTPQKSKE